MSEDPSIPADESAKSNNGIGQATDNLNPQDAAELVTKAELPMFYKSVALLNSEAHSGLKINPIEDFSFAREAAAIVIAAAEFAEAAAHYPIVFGRAGNGLTAYVVTGHTTGKNLYLDENSHWRPDTYIPAYVRRYPFLLLETKEDDRLSLLADLESGLFEEQSGEPLYVDKKPSKSAEKALEFCLNYHREVLNSEALYKQIDDAGILIERNADVSLPDSTQARITGFHVVDEQKLRDLDDEKFLELRRSGALTLAYCQLWSMRAWGNLLG